MTLFAQKKLPLQVIRTPELGLIVAKSPSDPWKLDLHYSVGGHFYRQELALLDMSIRQAIYYDDKQLLATLHAGRTLAFWRLARNAETCRFEHGLLRRITVPAGFKIWGEYCVRDKLVLHKHWQCSFGQNEVEMSELLLIDLQTYKQKRVTMPHFEIQKSVIKDNQILVKEADAFEVTSLSKVCERM